MRLPSTVYALTSAGLTAVTLAVASPAVLAAWRTTAAQASAAGRAVVLPAGAAPTGSARGSTVTLTWTTMTFASGAPVRGYRVLRTNTASGQTVAAEKGCAGVQTKTTCTESSVPSGSWKYGVVALVGDKWASAVAYSTVLTIA